MTDILLDSNMDLAIGATGDLLTGVSDEQHQQLLLLTQKGDWKEFPTAGVDMFEFLDDEDSTGLSREIRLQFSQDGMQVQSIALNPQGQLQISAVYVNS